MTASSRISSTEVHRLKRAPVSDALLPVVLERWSPRSFDSREVNPADLKRVFEAARWAPSSFNEQPWRFIIGQRGSATFQKIASSLSAGNQPWAPNAPVLILGVAKTHFTQNNNPNYYALFDLGAASAIVTLQAASMGLATHQMAGYDREAARRSFGIPEEFAMGSVMALGYQGEPSALPNEKLIEMETSPRTRKPLSEIVLEAWGVPAMLA
jgi:nitroreductase